MRFKVHDPKAHSKGGTLENTINGGRGGGEEDNPGPPPHILHPGKVIFDTITWNTMRNFLSCNWLALPLCDL